MEKEIKKEKKRVSENNGPKKRPSYSNACLLGDEKRRWKKSVNSQEEGKKMLSKMVIIYIIVEHDDFTRDWKQSPYVHDHDIIIVMIIIIMETWYDIFLL